MKPPWSASGARNGARPSRRTSPATSSCSLGGRPRSSTAPGTSATPAGRSGTCSATCDTPRSTWMAATLDGIVEGTEAVFEAKFMLPWSFSEEAAAEKYMAQLQHNMWVTHLRSSVLSVITGGGKWVEIAIPHGSALSAAFWSAAEKKFWRCVQSGEVPHLINAEPPRPRIEAIRIVDMSSSNSWAEFAALFRNTRDAFLDHERAKSELKALMPEDAREAIGHGVRGRRSKSGAVSFDVLTTEAVHAPLQ